MKKKKKKNINFWYFNFKWTQTQNELQTHRPRGPSIKYVTLFLANFDPPLPLSHFITHLGNPPESTPHISDPPIFSRPSTKIPDKSPLYKFYLNCLQRFLSGGFCPGWLLSVTIHLLQQKVKHHFKFHVSYV